MNHYIDYKNRGNIRILTALFPEQTKTIPRTIVWGIIFLLELILGVLCAAYFGLLPGSKLVTALIIAAIVGVFWLQGVIWYAFAKLFRKRKTSPNAN